MKNIKYRKATITLKKKHWTGSRLLEKGATFKDDECFEGKYQFDTAKVVFDDESPKPSLDKDEGKDESPKPNRRRKGVKNEK